MCNLDLYLSSRYIENYTGDYYEYCKVRKETRSVGNETPVHPFNAHVSNQGVVK